MTTNQTRRFAVGMFTTLACVSNALAQNVFDDFSSGNDNAWTRIDSPALYLGTPSIYAVENEAYRLRQPVFPNVGLNPPTGAVRVDGAAADSQISVDVVNWSSTTNQVISVGARFQQVAPDAFRFYTLSFFPVSNAGPGLSNFRIDRWNPDGTSVSLTNNSFFPIVDPLLTYRMVFTLQGTSLHGDLYSVSGNSTTLLRSVSTVDFGAAITGVGLPGVLVYQNGVAPGSTTVGPAEATFDNFRVVPAPGAGATLAVAALAASRRRRR